MKINYQRIIPPLVLMLAALVLFFIIPSSVSVGSSEPPVVNSRFLPYLATIIIFLCSVVDAINIYRSEKKAPTKPVEIDREWKSGMLRVLAAIVSIVIWILINQPLGYIISTILLALAIMLLTGSRNQIALVALPVILSVSTYIIFGRFVGVHLSPGPLPF